MTLFTTLDAIFWSETNVRTLLPAVLAMALFSLWMRNLLLHKPDRIQRIPFLVLTILLLILEVIKQAVEISHGYIGYYAVPLHFSSIFLYLYPLAHFTKGRFSRRMEGIAGLASGMSGLFLILFPMVVIGDSAGGFFQSFGSFHTVVYHYALVLYFFLFITLERHVPDWKTDLKGLFLVITIYTAIAAPAANILKTNFNSYYTCGFGPAEILRQQFVSMWGLWPTQIIYTLIMYAATLFFGFVIFEGFTLAAKGMTAWSSKPRRLPRWHWRPETDRKIIISASFDPCRIDPVYELSPCCFFSSRFIKL
jgi:small-conductance mechanosensitive channel